MSDDIRQEIDEHKKNLLELRKKIVIYREQKSGDRQYTSQDGVLVVAIDGLLMTLGTTDPTKITLESIVKLDDDIQEVVRSSEVFLQRHAPNPVV